MLRVACRLHAALLHCTAFSVLHNVRCVVARVVLCVAAVRRILNAFDAQRSLPQDTEEQYNNLYLYSPTGSLLHSTHNNFYVSTMLVSPDGEYFILAGTSFFLSLSHLFSLLTFI
jgi:hypothetical protein